MPAKLEHRGACRFYAGAVDPPPPQRVLLVGELNPYGANPEHALFCAPDGSAGHLLQERVLGLSRSNYLNIWRTNLCVRTWVSARARERVDQLLCPDVPWDRIVMLGVKVANAFASRAGAAQVWSSTGVGVEVVSDGATARVARVINLISFPHPSARSRIWNTPGAIGNARELMRMHAPEIPCGEVERWRPGS